MLRVLILAIWTWLVRLWLNVFTLPRKENAAIKDGAALLASHMDMPVVPVYLTGVEQVMCYQSIEIAGLFQKVGIWYGD